MLDNTENKNDSVLSGELQEGQHQIGTVPALKSTLKIKKKVITEEYKLAGQVLGIGINGKVWEIFQKKNGKHYALKVAIYFVHVYIFDSFIPKLIHIEANEVKRVMFLHQCQ